jgi:hypothetical protein
MLACVSTSSGLRGGTRREPRRGAGGAQDGSGTYLSRQGDGGVDVCFGCRLTVGVDADAYGRITVDGVVEVFVWINERKRIEVVLRKRASLPLASTGAFPDRDF